MNIKGHTKVILTDVHTGEQEIHEDDNMVTNAISNYFANCGFVNYPNLDKNTLVEELLGGVMAFSDDIMENANTIFVPAGNTMVANGSYETINNGNPTELGSYSSTESGWQSDGRFVQVYDFSTSQGNGTISCVCLTGKDFAYCGLGNATSNESHSTRRDITNLRGSHTACNPSSITEYICHVSLSDSSMYAVDFADIANGNLTIRKYRLPISKLNLKGKLTELIVLSETTISAPQHMVENGDRLFKRDTYSKLMVWNVNENVISQSPYWGSGHTQYLWEIDAVNGTVTESVISNTSGDDLYEMCNPFFCNNNNTVVFINGMSLNGYYTPWCDSTTIYQLNRSTGVISKTTNPYGDRNQSAYIENACYDRGWVYPYSTGGNIIITGNGNHTLIYDTDKKVVLPTNGGSMFIAISGSTISHVGETDNPLIGFVFNARNSSSHPMSLFRRQNYIASINNLDTPVVKTAEKTMKIVYSLTFTDS